MIEWIVTVGLCVVCDWHENGDHGRGNKEEDQQTTPFDNRGQRMAYAQTDHFTDSASNQQIMRMISQGC